jgi:hypothetical protein
MWLMNGTALKGGGLLLRDDSWKVIATPDLNGDGKADLLWYNASAGSTAVWLMDGVTDLARSWLLTDPNWKVIDTADFDGDGKADLLWYNAAARHRRLVDERHLVRRRRIAVERSELEGHRHPPTSTATAGATCSGTTPARRRPARGS